MHDRRISAELITPGFPLITIFISPEIQSAFLLQVRPHFVFEI